MTSFDLPKLITLDGAGVAIAFAYDGGGRRVRKTRAQADVVYVGELYERVTPADPSAPIEHRFYVYSGERLVAAVTRRAGAPDERLFSTPASWFHSAHPSARIQPEPRGL